MNAPGTRPRGGVAAPTAFLRPENHCRGHDWRWRGMV